MKILQINTTDLMGGRFNGRDLNAFFRRKGHETSQCVWEKKGGDTETWSLGEGLIFHDRLVVALNLKLKKLINYIVTILEKIVSLQSLIYPWGVQLMFDKRFEKADVVHYHLLHNDYFSLLTLPKLIRLKPSVWTIHDPWAMTGHCVYPQDCERWKIGCGDCPDINRFIPMLYDNSGLMFRIKKYVYRKLDIDLVFASKFMLDMAEESPLFKGLRKRYIPFGVNLDVFKRTDKGVISSSFGVKEGNLVVSFRSTNYEYKGLKYIKSALNQLAHEIDHTGVTILTVNCKGLLGDLPNCYQLIELGCVTDEKVLADFYNCSDIFLMPSTGEAFGMMAIEAMACGTPVIVFDGTSLPDVVFAPRGGVSVPMYDSDALAMVIKRLLLNPEERKKIGDSAFELSREHYDFDKHALKVMKLYEEVVERRQHVI